MPRVADDILIGGGRVFLDNQEIGWLQGDITLNEQAQTLTVKESEGAKVLILPLDKEVHFTFNLLEANLSTLRMINPSYSAVRYAETEVEATDEYIADMGKSNGLKNVPVLDTVEVEVYPATTLTEGLQFGATTIIVENGRRFEVGDTIDIVKGEVRESFTVDGKDDDEITLNKGVMNAFPSGSLVKITTASKKMKLGTDYMFYPALGLITRHSESTDVLEKDGACITYMYHQNKGTGYAMGSFTADSTYKLEFWHKKRSGKFRCIRMYKASIAGDFTPFSITQDNETPIAIDVILKADESIADTTRNIYEQVEYPAEAAPGGGW